MSSTVYSELNTRAGSSETKALTETPITANKLQYKRKDYEEIIDNKADP